MGYNTEPVGYTTEVWYIYNIDPVGYNTAPVGYNIEVWDITLNLWDITLTLWDITLDLWDITLNLWDITLTLWDIPIEIHRIEVTRPCFSRPARKLRHWVAPLRWLCTQHMDGRDVLHIFVDNSKTLRNFEITGMIDK